VNPLFPSDSRYPKIRLSTRNFESGLKDDAGIEKYKYGYNYRKGDEVLFRYDNAHDPGAKKLASFPHHKHLGKDIIIESEPVNLWVVMEEIEKTISEQRISEIIGM